MHDEDEDMEHGAALEALKHIRGILRGRRIAKKQDPMSPDADPVLASAAEDTGEADAQLGDELPPPALGGQEDGTDDIAETEPEATSLERFTPRRNMHRVAEPDGEKSRMQAAATSGPVVKRGPGRPRKA